MQTLTSPLAEPRLNPPASASAGTLYRRVWRWHFYAGLICLPFIVSLAVTGALYLFHRQIDDVVYAHLLLRPAGNGAAGPVAPHAMLAPEELIRRAQQAVPGRPKSIAIPGDAQRTVQVDVARADGATVQVFLDPASGRLLGSIAESQRVMAFIKRLHSLAVAGDAGNVVIEIVAGWIIVLTVTGAYLWWPRGRRAGVLAIRRGASGRTWWRDLHAVTGAFAAVVILFLALTGMPWSVFWGQNVNRWLTEHGLGVPDGMWKNVPKSALPAAAVGELPWAQQQMAVPASDDPHAEHKAAAASSTALTATAYRPLGNPAVVQPAAIMQTVSALGIVGGYRLALPRDERGVYTLVRSTGQLDGNRVIHFNQYSGRVLLDLSAAQLGPVARVTEWGVSVHQGAEYGWPNLLVMLAGCLALIALCVSGIVVWWHRRPAGKLGAPARKQDDRLAARVLAVAALLGAVFPLLGLSMLTVCGIDYGAARWRARSRAMRQLPLSN